MKYLVMVQGTQAAYDAMSGKASAHSAAWNEQDMRTMFAHMGAINDDLAESGELLDCDGLAAPATARLVSLGEDGRPVITDGPYGETKELLAGYWVLDCESLERATEIAARAASCPQPAGTPRFPVVIRPIQDVAGGHV